MYVKHHLQNASFYDTMSQIVAILIMPNGFKQPMSGQIAVITGSRLKMGYLYYIDAFAWWSNTMIATTRFPISSALRFFKNLVLPLEHSPLVWI
jgi:hypothetical protein